MKATSPSSGADPGVGTVTFNEGGVCNPWFKFEGYDWDVPGAGDGDLEPEFRGIESGRGDCCAEK